MLTGCATSHTYREWWRPTPVICPLTMVSTWHHLVSCRSGEQDPLVLYEQKLCYVSRLARWHYWPWSGANDVPWISCMTGHADVSHRRICRTRMCKESRPWRLDVEPLKGGCLHLRGEDQLKRLTERSTSLLSALKRLLWVWLDQSRTLQTWRLPSTESSRWEHPTTSECAAMMVLEQACWTVNVKSLLRWAYRCMEADCEMKVESIARERALTQQILKKLKLPVYLNTLFPMRHLLQEEWPASAAFRCSSHWV